MTFTHTSFLVMSLFMGATWVLAVFDFTFAWNGTIEDSKAFIEFTTGLCLFTICFIVPPKMISFFSFNFIRLHNDARYSGFLAMVAGWAWCFDNSDVFICSTAGACCCIIGIAIDEIFRRRDDPGAASDDSSPPGLFDDPPPRPDCDICSLPMPFRFADRVSLPCCGMEICGGCYFRIFIDVDNGSCPFCRYSGSEEEMLPRLQERVERGDARAMVHLAYNYETGDGGLPLDVEKALDLYRRAADLGDSDACFRLGRFYHLGQGVPEDVEKAREYYVSAANSGHILAHSYLGDVEYDGGRKGLAVRHWRISAAAGDSESIGLLSTAFDPGFICKDFLDESRRAFEIASEAMQSDDRRAWSSLIENIEEGFDS